MGNYKKKIGPKGRQRDIDSNYLKGAHSWSERMLKYSELCSLDFYLIKYEVIQHFVSILRKVQGLLKVQNFKKLFRKHLKVVQML